MTIDNSRRLNRVGLAVAAAYAFAAFSPAASAAPLNLTSGDTIKLTTGGAAIGNADGGGEFNVNGVSVAHGAGDSFLTFCLEYSEHFSPGSTYFVQINTAAITGDGVAATYPGDVAGTAGVSDPISSATAWLYTHFRAGDLGSFVSGFSNSSAADVNSLQAAIWHLENEGDHSAYNSMAISLVNAAVNAATTHLGGWTGIGDVRVLNLFDTYSGGTFSGNHQDQLYLLPTPIPEPETYAMLLAGLGLMGFVARRRKASRIAG